MFTRERKLRRRLAAQYGKRPDVQVIWPVWAGPAGRIVDGGEIEISPQESAAYGGRLWAVRQDNGDWVFEDVPGFGYYAYRYENEAEEGVANHLDEGIIGGGMNYIVDDDGERVELSGTVYVTPGAGLEFYCNPVYQTADGAVYLTGGSGIDTNGEREGEAVLSRQLVDIDLSAEDPAELVTFCPRADGICVRQATELIFTQEGSV